MPLKSKTVAGLILKRIGTKTVEPNMANRCCKLRGMALAKGGRSFTGMIESSFMKGNNSFG